MQKRIIHILLLVCLLSLTFSCQTESYDFVRKEGSIEIFEDGSLRVPIQLYIPEREVVETKSIPNAVETTINNAYVVVFDNTDEHLVECAEAMTDTGDKSKIYARLKVYPSACLIQVLVNLSEANMEQIKSATKLDDIRDMKDSSAETLDKGLLPMASDRIYLDVLNVDNVQDLVVSLKFAYARIDLKSIDQGFTLAEAFVLNAPKEGYMIEHTGLIADAGGEERSKTVSAKNAEINGLYLFENSGAQANQSQGTNPTDLLIKGTKTGCDEGYYKIRISYSKDNSNTYDIRRGVRYVVNITNVKGPGYTTATEAIANEPANVEYDITVDDGSSKDVIISNGKYYLGVSNSEFIILADDAYGVTATTFKHNAPSTVTNARIEVLGQGITLSANQPDFTMNVERTKATFDLAKKEFSIRIDLTSSSAGGWVTIRIGDLVKAVAIKRKTKVPDEGKTISLSDLDLTSVATMSSLSPRITVNQSDKSLVVGTAVNTKFDAYSYAEAFTGQKGTIRIAVQQTIQNVVYYEQYADDTYGFYFQDKTSTLSEEKQIKDTGYGVLGTRTDITEIRLGNHLTGQLFNPVKTVVSGGMDCSLTLYPMSHETITPVNNNQALGVLINGAQTTLNYIYPNFAKIVTTSSAISDGGMGFTPFLIRTPKQFQNINRLDVLNIPGLNGLNFKQERDLNFSEENVGGGPFSASIVKNFTGIYDGNFKKIANVSISSTQSNIALFGTLEKKSTTIPAVKKLIIEGFSITAFNTTACLVATNKSGVISDILVRSSIVRSTTTGSANAGMIAGVNGQNILRCLVEFDTNTSYIFSANTNSQEGQISAFVGGIAGYSLLASSTISDCCVISSTQGEVIKTKSKISVGGIVGTIGSSGSFAKVEKCVSLIKAPICYDGSGVVHPVVGHPLGGTVTSSCYLRSSSFNNSLGTVRPTPYTTDVFSQKSVSDLGLSPDFWIKDGSFPYPRLKSFVGIQNVANYVVAN